MILKSLDQKLGELNHRNINYSKNERENFLGLFLADSPIREGRYSKKYFDKTMHAPATVAAYLAYSCWGEDVVGSHVSCHCPSYRSGS